MNPLDSWLCSHEFDVGVGTQSWTLDQARLGYRNQCCEIVPRIENWQIWGTSPHYGLHICMVSRYFWVSFSGVSSSYALASAATSASSHHHLSPFMDVLFELHVAIPKKMQVTVSMDYCSVREKLNRNPRYVIIFHPKIHGFWLRFPFNQSSDSRFSNEHHMFDCTIIINIPLLFGISPLHSPRITIKITTASS